MAESFLALLTDFGLEDPYVGVVKGVIYSINPKATVIDLTHQIPPQDIKKGAFFLASSIFFLPKMTVVMAIVDPGVGGKRRPVVLRAFDRFFVAPDNGLLTGILLMNDPLQKAWMIERQDLFLEPVSTTFHARDIFAPTAAWLSLGNDPEALGTEIKDLVTLKWDKPIIEKDALKGQVIVIDHFGNLITNIHKRDLTSITSGKKPWVIIKDKKLPIVTTYAQVEKGKPLALIGSSDYLEISINMGNAAEVLEAGEGEVVKVTC